MGETSDLKIAIYSDNAIDWSGMTEAKPPTDPGKFKSAEELLNGGGNVRLFVQKLYCWP